MFGIFWNFTVLYKKSAVAISRDPVSSLPGAQDCSQNHLYKSCFSSTGQSPAVHTELRFFWGVSGCSWDPVCLACYQGKYENDNYRLLLDDFF